MAHNDSRNDLLNKYKHLVKISSDNMPQLIDELRLCCMDRFNTLKWSIKLAITAYSSSITRNARVAISDIATLSSDLSIIAKTAMDQQLSFLKSLVHLSGPWTTLLWDD